MLAKRFFYVSAGLLCLALAYHFGASSAAAQAPANPVVATYGNLAYTANGDVYYDGGTGGSSWVWRGNVFGGGPTPASQKSWGQVKIDHAAPVAPTNR